MSDSYKIPTWIETIRKITNTRLSKYQSEESEEKMKYKISWKKEGKYRSIIVSTKAEMLAEVADKTTLSDKVIVKVVSKQVNEID